MSDTKKSASGESFPLPEALKELKDADDAYRRMVKVGVGNFADYDRAWRDFLQCVDRAWNKLCAEAEGRKNWQKLKSEYEHLRKTDSLLKYVVQARNVSEHSIAPIVREWEPRPRHFVTDEGVSLEWDDWDRPLLPVVNRGTTFLPPRKHLGKPMESYRRKGVSEPRTVAELTMKFYVDVFNRVSLEVLRSVK